jgi:hypothetical protein
VNPERRFLAGLAAALAAAAAVPASAQFGIPGGGGRRGGGGRSGGNSDKSADKGAVGPAPTGIDQFEATVDELRSDLRLTGPQQPGWDAYIGKVRALAGDVQRERTQARIASTEAMSAPQRIDRAVDAARNRLAALEEIADSAKALYASLAPEQKPVADARLPSLITLAAGGPTSSRPSGSDTKDKGRSPP